MRVTSSPEQAKTAFDDSAKPGERQDSNKRFRPYSRAARRVDVTSSSSGGATEGALLPSAMPMAARMSERMRAR